MKKNLKRILALMLTVLMLVGVAPMNGLVDITDAFSPKASAAEGQYKTGDIIEFGSYPQSEVTDSATISKLDGVSKNWISYGYYSGTGR